MFPVIRQLARRPTADAGGTFANITSHDSESNESASEDESEICTSDADSEEGQFILLDDDQFEAIMNSEQAIEEQDMSESLEVHFGQRKEKKFGFRRNYKATRQKLLGDRLNRGFRDKRQSTSKTTRKATAIETDYHFMCFVNFS